MCVSEISISELVHWHEINIRVGFFWVKWASLRSHILFLKWKNCVVSTTSRPDRQLETCTCMFLVGEIMNTSTSNTNCNRCWHSHGYCSRRRMNSKSYLLRQLGSIKLSVLPLSKRALICNPLVLTIPDDFGRISEAPTVVKCKRPGHSWNFILADLPSAANVCKMVLFLTFWASCITRRTFWRRVVIVSTEEASRGIWFYCGKWLGSLWSSTWIVAIGTAALTDEGRIWSWA